MSRREDRSTPLTEAEALAQYLKDLDEIQKLVDDLVFDQEYAGKVIDGLTREFKDNYPPPQFPDEVVEL